MFLFNVKIFKQQFSSEIIKRMTNIGQIQPKYTTVGIPRTSMRMPSS